MSTFLEFAVALLVFGLGLRLSAFFSGSETGFYRASFLRISIDAQAGDPVAKRLLWFARNPSTFVATTLVGNNVANYFTTFAIGLGTVAFFGSQSEWLEIVATLLVAPLVFICGELLPKNLYYRAPLHFLRRDANRLTAFYYLFYPVSFLFIMLSKAFERIGKSEDEQTGLILGRSRLVQVLSQGQRAGILTATQTRLVRGVMNAAGQTVGSSATPSARVLGVAENSSREEILEFARQYGISVVPIHQAGDSSAWTSYVRVVDLAVSRRPVASLMQEMPQIAANCGKLDALIQLREAELECGVVVADSTVIGVISTHGLTEQLFRQAGVLSLHAD